VPLITTDEVHAHVETDRSPDAIALLVADAEGEIIARYGPHPGPQTEVTLERLLDQFALLGPTAIFLDRPATEIVSVSEFAGSPYTETETTLDPTDYRLLYGGRALGRLATGSHSRSWWSGRVVITYRPIDDLPQRRRVCIDLVKLALRYNATKEVVAGDVREFAYDDYTQERSNLLDELGQSVAFV